MINDLLERLKGAGSPGLDLSPGDPLCREAEEEIRKLMKVLQECAEYLDQRAEVDHNGVGFISNEEMQILENIERVLSDD